MVQVLGTLLVAASGVLLVSALWRMNLYVGAYGLSFKRALTYWGMAVLAVLLGSRPVEGVAPALPLVPGAAERGGGGLAAP